MIPPRPRLGTGRGPLGLAGARRRDGVVLVALVALLTLPFLDKAFHIDDAYFLRIIENIRANPLDPFAGSIDWWDRPLPIWDLASNPPLLNYYLAPFAALSGASERVLHLAMIPSLLLLAFATLALARRFSPAPLLATCCVVASPGVAASLNIMRDVPAAALATSAVAAVVAGTDRRDARVALAGFFLAGAALHTRFTAIAILPLLVLYPILRGRARFALGVLVPLALFALWCLHNELVYGEPQLVAQLRRGHNAPGHAWREALAGLPVVVGSLCYLLPALLTGAVRRRDAVALAATSLACVAAFVPTWRYLRGAADAQYLFWSLTGTALLFLCGLAALRGVRRLARRPADAAARDDLFLLAWLGVQIGLAVWLVPFQAVRHLIPALPPLVLIAFRALGTTRSAWPSWQRPLLAGLVAVQLVVALVVAEADREYADVYRAFASRAAEHAGTGASPLWFVGHWGWLHYAERAGLRQLHTTGPYPKPGERLVVPLHVDKGSALRRLPSLERALRKVDEVTFPGHTPLRTVHVVGGGFYALRSRRPGGLRPAVPYRWLPGAPLEIFEIHAVHGTR